jgi:hypothetical protein
VAKTHVAIRDEDEIAIGEPAEATV